MAHEHIPDSVPDLSINQTKGRSGAAAGSTRASSVGGKSTTSVISTTLGDKGLEGTPVAEKHKSKRTGKDYWLYRNSEGKFVSRTAVAELGFAWWPKEGDHTRGMLKRVGGASKGQAMPHEEARKKLESLRSKIDAS